MMDPDDHSETRGVVDLGLRQMNPQVADSPIQDVMQGQPDLGHSVDVQPAADRDLLSGTYLRHARRALRSGALRGDQSHLQLPSSHLQCSPCIARHVQCWPCALLAPALTRGCCL